MAHISFVKALVIIRCSIGRANWLLVRRTVFNAHAPSVFATKRFTHRIVVARDVDTRIEIWIELMKGGITKRGWLFMMMMIKSVHLVSFLF